MSRSLSQYYGDKGQVYTTAKQVADAFMADIDAHPKYFRRDFIAEKLRISSDRELSLLSDALSIMKTRGLIVFDRTVNMWKNLSRS